MKKIDAEREIKKIWLNWDEPEDKYGAHFGLSFYFWLQRNMDHLLSFRCTGDKYQEINGWVIRWQKEYPW